MVVNFRHKGLRDLFLHERTSGVMVKYVQRLRHRLAVIDAASKVIDINTPGYKLHPLVDGRGGIWVISVLGDWHVTFEFASDDACVLDYEDYH